MASKALDYALRLITHRDRSVREVTERLLRKFPEDEGEVKEAVDYLVEIGYVDDWKFAQNHVISRNRLRPTGNYVLRMELIAKGVSESIIDEVLNSAQMEYELAVTLVRKRVSSMTRLDEDKKARRLFGLLQRRGFPWHTAQRAVREILDSDPQKDYN